jgi:hypothetical protein
MSKNIIGMANINAQEFQNINIQIPPIALQTQFATLVARVEGLKTRQREALRQAEELYRSLLQRAFRGELDVNRVPAPPPAAPLPAARSAERPRQGTLFDLGDPRLPQPQRLGGEIPPFESPEWFHLQREREAAQASVADSAEAKLPEQPDLISKDPLTVTGEIDNPETNLAERHVDAPATDAELLASLRIRFGTSLWAFEEARQAHSLDYDRWKELFFKALADGALQQVFIGEAICFQFPTD